MNDDDDIENFIDWFLYEYVRNKYNLLVDYRVERTYTW